MELNEKNIKHSAVITVSEIWTCIDWDKVDAKRAYGIWDEYASKIKAAALTTNSYEKFVEKLARKMEIRSLRYKEILNISKQSDEFKQEVLKRIREETLQIVLELRLNNEARKELQKSIKENK